MAFPKKPPKFVTDWGTPVFQVRMDIKPKEQNGIVVLNSFDNYLYSELFLYLYVARDGRYGVVCASRRKDTGRLNVGYRAIYSRFCEDGINGINFVVTNPIVGNPFLHGSTCTFAEAEILDGGEYGRSLVEAIRKISPDLLSKPSTPTSKKHNRGSFGAWLSQQPKAALRGRYGPITLA